MQIFLWTRACDLLMIPTQHQDFVIAVCGMFLALICPLVWELPDFHN